MAPHSTPRRIFIKAALTSAALPLALTACGESSTTSAASNAGKVETSSLRLPKQVAPLFLTDAEMLTLQALVEQLIPADDSPGGSASGCADAIQFLLSAFSFDPPMIFAGGPFSNRGGSNINHFEKFIALDHYEELAWRLRIEGSRDLPERSFNGPVTGWQSIYREGLAALDAAAGTPAIAFSNLPGPLQQAAMSTPGNEAVAALINVAFPHALEAMYGAPEYGGNRDLTGWRFTDYDGDVQPRGYTTEQVLNPDNPGLLEMLGLFRGENQGTTSGSGRTKQAALLPVPSTSEAKQLIEVLTQLTAMHSDELSLAMMIDGQSSLQRIQEFVRSKQPQNPAIQPNIMR